MIILFGPTGSGKSVQGQLLAARHGWRWISAGQLLRDSHDPRVYKYMLKGKLAPNKFTNQLVFDEIDKVRTSGEERKHILDGFPRDLSQAKALVEHEIEHTGKPMIDIVIVINMTNAEVLRRLKIRGRMEDNPETIAYRLKTFHEQVEPVVEYLASLNVPIEHVDGVGTVGEVHDRIEKVLEAHGVVGAF